MKKADIINKVYQLELSKRATLVVFYLINRANSELTCFPGIKTIARECNMSTRTVQRALGDLEEVGLVRKESRFHEQGGQRSNMYYLQIPEEGEEMLEELDFELYNDEEKAHVVIDTYTPFPPISCVSRLNETSNSPIYLPDNLIETYVSWGDGHCDSP